MLGLFAIQQIFIFSRIWIKLTFYSSQMDWYQTYSRMFVEEIASEEQPENSESV